MPGLLGWGHTFPVALEAAVTTPEPATTAEAAPLEPIVAPRAPRSVWALWLGIIAWPRSTFDYLREAGGRAWLWPLSAALLLTLAARLVAVPIERAQAAAALAALQEQIQDQPDGSGGAVTFGFAFGGGPAKVGVGAPAARSAWQDYGWPLLGVLGQWLLTGLLLFVLAWLLGGRPAAGAMLRASAWALVPLMAGLLVSLGVMLSSGRLPVTGLATSFAAAPANGAASASPADDSAAPDGDGAPPQVVKLGGPGAAGGPSYWMFLRAALLERLNLYTLWRLVLLGIAVATTARLGWLKASLATLGYFGVGLAAAALAPLASLWLVSLTGGGIGPIF